MCTVRSSEQRALVCDSALPFVRSALAQEPGLAVAYQAKPGDGTEIRLLAGDLATFERYVRIAVARANE
jgi:hypothetical protein